MGSQIFTTTMVNKTTPLNDDSIRYLNRDFIGVMIDDDMYKDAYYKLSNSGYLSLNKNGQPTYPPILKKINDDYIPIPIDNPIYCESYQLKICRRQGVIANKDALMSELLNVIRNKLTSGVLFADIYGIIDKIVVLVTKNYKNSPMTYIECQLKDTNNMVLVPVHALHKDFSNKKKSFNSGDLLELVYIYCFHKLFLHSESSNKYNILNLQGGSIRINENAPCLTGDTFKKDFIEYIQDISTQKYKSGHTIDRKDKYGHTDKVRLVIDSKIGPNLLTTLIDKFYENGIDLMKSEVIKTLNNRKAFLMLARMTYEDNFPNVIDIISLGKYDTETAKMDLLFTVTLKNNKRMTIPISLKNSNSALLAQRGIADLFDDSIDKEATTYFPLMSFLWFFLGVKPDQLQTWATTIKNNNNDIVASIAQSPRQCLLLNHIVQNTNDFCQGINRSFFGSGSILTELNNLPQELQLLKEAYHAQLKKYNDIKKSLIELGLTEIVNNFEKILKEKTLYDKLGKNNTISQANINKLQTYLNRQDIKNKLAIYRNGENIYIAIEHVPNDRKMNETLFHMRIKNTNTEKKLYLNIGNSHIFD